MDDDDYKASKEKFLRNTSTTVDVETKKKFLDRLEEIKRIVTNPVGDTIIYGKNVCDALENLLKVIHESSDLDLGGSIYGLAHVGSALAAKYAQATTAQQAVINNEIDIMEAIMALSSTYMSERILTQLNRKNMN